MSTRPSCILAGRLLVVPKKSRLFLAPACGLAGMLLASANGWHKQRFQIGCCLARDTRVGAIVAARVLAAGGDVY
jgi:hypothetical protein